MLNAIITWSIQHRRWVVLGWLAVAVGRRPGVHALPLDAFPDTTPVQVQINVTAPSLAPLEIERQLTFPVEQAISGLPGLSEVRSVSRFGYAQVTVTFDDGTDALPGSSGGERAPAARGAAARHRAPLARAAVHRPRRGLPLSRERATGSRWPSSAVPTTGSSSRSSARCRAWPRSTRGGATSARSRSRRSRAPPHLRPRASTTWSRPSSRTWAHWVVAPSTRRASPPSCAASALLGQLRDVEEVVVTTVPACPSASPTWRGWSRDGSCAAGAATADGKGEVVLGLGFMLIGQNSHDVTTAWRLRLEEVRALAARRRSRPACL
jgi:cobalt-zinc-cadmium resistance protein CzcA